MPDLNTGSPYVQDQIATYMKTLLGWGVAGFRIDAAKHMAPTDVKAILDKAGSPRAYLEVIGAGGESPDIQPGRYTYIDTVTDFKYGTDPPPTSTARSRTSRRWASWGLLPPTRPSSSWSTTTANAATAGWHAHLHERCSLRSGQHLHDGLALWLEAGDVGLSLRKHEHL